VVFRSVSFVNVIVRKLRLGAQICDTCSGIAFSPIFEHKTCKEICRRGGVPLTRNFLIMKISHVSPWSWIYWNRAYYPTSSRFNTRTGTRVLNCPKIRPLVGCPYTPTTLVESIVWLDNFNNLYFTMKHDSNNKKSIALYSKKKINYNNLCRRRSESAYIRQVGPTR